MSRLDYSALNSTIRYLMFSVFAVRPGELGDDRDQAKSDATDFFKSLEDEGVVVRVTLKTAPMEQWEVARAMRERIKARFNHEGIEFAQWGVEGETYTNEGGTRTLPADIGWNALNPEHLRFLESRQD